MSGRMLLLQRTALWKRRSLVRFAGQISFSSWAMSLGSPSRQRYRLEEPSDIGEYANVKK
jgi:hypothetical protein